MADTLRQNNDVEKTVYADELIIADHKMNRLTMVENYALDLSFGQKDTSFEARLIYPRLKGGEFIYIAGTEYGGIVDSVQATTGCPEVVYKGRTWHGILDSKIIKNTRIKVSANQFLENLILDNELGYIFHFVRDLQGDVKLDYTPEEDEPMSAYKLLRAALKKAGLKLCMKLNGSRVDIWVERSETIENTLVSAIANFTAERTLFIPNHLIAYGELQGDNRNQAPERLTMHLYADKNGNISKTQTLKGAQEIQIYKAFSGFKHDKGKSVSQELKTQLEQQATEELKKLQRFAKAETSVLGNSDWNVGDIVHVRDYNVGFDITTDITEKVVRVEQGVMNIDYSVGSDTAKAKAIAVIQPPRPNKVFSWFPGNEYASGDIWVNKDDEEVRLATNNSTGSFNPNDWVVVSNLSDDALSQEAITIARDVKSDVSRVEAGLDSAKSKIEEAVQEVSEVKTDVSQAAAKVRAVEGEVNKAKADITRLDGVVVQASTDVQRVSAGLTETKANLNSVETRISEVSTKSTEALNNTREVKSTLNEVKRNVEEVAYDTAKGESETRRALDTALKLEGMPTLIRQDPTGIIVGKAKGDGYKEGSMVTRQSSDGAFEICSVGKNGELTVVSSFTEHDITLGNPKDIALRSIRIGSTSIRSKTVWTESGPGTSEPGVEVTSLQSKDVLTIGAKGKVKGASIHLNAGHVQKGFSNKSNITLNAETISITEALDDIDERVPKIWHFTAEEVVCALGGHHEINNTYLPQIKCYKAGGVCILTSRGITDITITGERWGEYLTLNEKYRPDHDVVARTHGYVDGKPSVIDIKIDKAGKVYFRHWASGRKRVTFAPNITYIAADSYISGNNPDRDEDARG